MAKKSEQAFARKRNEKNASKINQKSNIWHFYYQLYLTQAHAAIQTGYAGAIVHYAVQRDRFLQELQLGADNGINDFVADLRIKLKEEFTSSFDPKFKEIVDLMMQAIDVELSKATSPKDISELLKKTTINIDSKDITQVGFKQIKQAVQAFIDQTNLFDIVKSIINASAYSTNNEAIMSQLQGLLRLKIMERLQYDNIDGKINSIKNSLKGLYREDAIEKGINELHGKVAARGTGSITDDKNAQIKIDILLGTVTGNLDGLAKSLISEYDMKVKSGKVSLIQHLGDLDDTTLLGGIQSKSWITPFTKGSRNFSTNTKMEIGGAAGLLPNEFAQHFWHAGVAACMSNLINLVGGGNFIYITGNEIYYTCDMLSEMQRNNIVAGFYMDAKDDDNDAIMSGAAGFMKHYGV